MGNKFKEGEVIVRNAIKEDMVAVNQMIKELADFERIPNGPKLTVQGLQRDGFESERPAFRCKVAELQSTGTVVGYVIYFATYSTWVGKAMMLEDLYVRENCRRCGIGLMLFRSIALEAAVTGCKRIDFHVLAWNNARAFYEAIGAENLTADHGAYYYRLSGDALSAVINQVSNA